MSTKPFSSRATAVAEPVGAGRGADEDEQPVGRRPPPRRRRPGRRSVERLEVTVAAARPTTSRLEPHLDVVGRPSIRSTRYCDMESLQRRRPGPPARPAWRTGRGSAPPGPAELAAPTTYDVVALALRAPRWPWRRSRRRGPLSSSSPGASSRRYETPVATSTERASISPAAVERTARTGPRISNPTTSRASTISAPNLDGLGHGPLGQVGAGQALGEAQVVLDRRALPGLPARRLALDHHGAAAPPRRRTPRPPGRPGPPPTMQRS